MSIWVLVLAIYTGSPLIVGQYSTKEACVKAANDIEVVSVNSAKYIATAYCVRNERIL